MEGHSSNRVPTFTQLRDRIALASYEVDPVAVADAIVRRRWRVEVVSPAVRESRPASRLRTRARVSCIADRRAGIGSGALAA